jgi:hypothetical protein
MHQAFEIELIEALKSIEGISQSRRYAGEMQNPESAEIKDSDLPLALVDFIEDKEVESGVNSSWNIYLLSVAYGKNAKDKNNADLLLIRERMRKTLKKSTLGVSSAINLNSFRKLFDAKSDKGYLTVYMQTLSVFFYDGEPIDADKNLE